MEAEAQAVHISDLFGGLVAPRKPSRKTERGELLNYLAIHTGRSIKYVAFKCTKLSVADLYYLKSDCTQAAARGVPFSAAFHQALKPQSSTVPESGGGAAKV